jgi:hypothetical protein
MPADAEEIDIVRQAADEGPLVRPRRHLDERRARLVQAPPNHVDVQFERRRRGPGRPCEQMRDFVEQVVPKPSVRLPRPPIAEGR